MKVLLQQGRLILIPEQEIEGQALAVWRAHHDNFAFATVPNAGTGVTLLSLGPADEACRRPIQVSSASPSTINLIANFAPTPFRLNGIGYACVEAFWQSLRFPLEERPRIAALDGPLAKHAAIERPYAATVHYGGQDIPTGTYDHWQLMRRACEAKFAQNGDARAALLGTGDRPLVHSVRRDSRSIPGIVMADIWMRLRAKLRSPPQKL